MPNPSARSAYHVAMLLFMVTVGIAGVVLIVHGLVFWLLFSAARHSTVLVDQCGRCGYDLRELMAGAQCPECGQPFMRDPTGRCLSSKQHRR